MKITNEISYQYLPSHIIDRARELAMDLFIRYGVLVEVIEKKDMKWHYVFKVGDHEFEIFHEAEEAIKNMKAFL